MTDQDSPIVSNQKGAFSTTIVIVVIVVVMMTAIGTWAVLNSISTGKETSGPAQSNTNVGIMTLNILPSTPPHTQDSGRLTLNIKK